MCTHIHTHKSTVPGVTMLLFLLCVNPSFSPRAGAALFSEDSVSSVQCIVLSNGDSCSSLFSVAFHTLIFHFDLYCFPFLIAFLFIYFSMSCLGVETVVTDLKFIFFLGV